MDHINLKKLFEYLEAGLDIEEMLETEAHIESCKSCKKIVEAYKTLQKRVSLSLNFSDEYKQKPECLDEGTLSLYLDGGAGLEKSEKENILRHIEECDRCLDHLAFYYKSAKAGDAEILMAPSSWVNGAVNQLASETMTEKVLSESILPFAVISRIADKLSSAVKRMNSRLSPLPAYGIAAVAVFFLLVNSFYRSTEVVNIVSSSRLEITKHSGDESLSLGFMDAEEKTVKKTEGMKVSIEGEKIKFTWESVPRAENLYIKIKEASGDSSREILKESVKGNSHLVPVSLIGHGKRYIWEISGNTPDGEEFRAISEFVMG